MTLERQQGKNWNDTANGNGIEWDGMKCIKIGSVPGHRAWQRQAEILRTATSTKDDKKSLIFLFQF